MAIRFPGHLADKDLQNLESVRSKAATIWTIPFTFDASNFANPKKVAIIPKNHSTLITTFVSVEEAFNDFNATLFLGTVETNYSISSWLLGAATGPRSISRFGEDYLSRFKSNKQILLVVGHAEGVTTGDKPTRGRGFGVLQYVKV